MPLSRGFRPAQVLLSDPSMKRLGKYMELRQETQLALPKAQVWALICD